MILQKNSLYKNIHHAPDCSDSPAARKAIFSSFNKATAGSSCCSYRKKALLTMAIAQGRNRHKRKVHQHPKASTQPAIVTDNNDPAGLGRVQVQMAWQKDISENTPWIRMTNPHAGGGKGMYFVPEVGEEVLVAFEAGNAEKPYVQGAMYNGNESSSYSTAGNDQKVIQTRSGTKVIMNDAAGSIFIEDPSGNTWMMDGKGNISVNAPNDITINAGGNISMTAGQNISSNATMNISETAGVDKSLSVGMIHNVFVGGDSILNVTGCL
jgi:type VI secretion system secreted protein VgrG